MLEASGKRVYSAREIQPAARLPLAANEKSVHFGKGQTETSLTLPPGKHTLQLVFGDSLHVPHDPPVISKKITITVEK